MSALAYPLERLFALIRSGESAPAELRRAVDLARRRGKTWIVVNVDTLDHLVAEIEARW